MEIPEIEYRILNDPSVQDVMRLHKIAGWNEPEDTTERVSKLIRGSFCFCGAFTSDGRMIGFMRALSDGVSDAYLLELIVDPLFRRKGVGGGIIRHVKTYLKKLGINWITVIGVPGTEAIYEREGFQCLKGCTSFCLKDERC